MKLKIALKKLTLALLPLLVTLSVSVGASVSVVGACYSAEEFKMSGCWSWVNGN